ncbi:MAG TPA: glycosyltransferase family 2 protein [Bacteroidia bacterium]|nr:glycosyltransferase family 2 protein [Bacteroidia bacterium]
MQLSVIIVNYNVRHFLEQCLISVDKACKTITAEIFVVDNNSVDGSTLMVREKFPHVKLIANTVNTGFAVANNQAIREAGGEYVLLLNPDTVVEEDTFTKCIAFMDSHPDAGGLGVYMIDGSGKFLPESKRGLPTPFTAFCKITGLSALFPRSRTFGRYHLGYLDKNETHEVDVLSGAFMWIRKSVLDTEGLLDESFFMYGEDIDLSYRIVKGGYKNYYFPGTRIIHYKGESTRKSSVNYVIVFYKAMIIFAKKHFSQQHASLFSMLIHIAVYARAAIAILHRIIRKILLPVSDALLFITGIILLKNYWEHSVKELHYPPQFVQIVIPAYILIWLTAVFFSGGYDKPIRISRAVRGVVTGTLFVLVVYALLSEEYRFSRALTLLGAAWACVAVVVDRYLLGLTGWSDYTLEKSDRKNLVIVGYPEEGIRVLTFLRQSESSMNFIGFISPGGGQSDSGDTLYASQLIGNVHNFKEIASVYEINEIIFCARDISSQDIINQMLRLGGLEIEYKIAPPESLFIIGSNSDATNGDLYLVEVNALDSKANRRNKRLFDIVTALFLLITFPVAMIGVNNKSGFLNNIFRVLFGKLTWIAPSLNREEGTGALTKSGFKPGVLRPSDGTGAHVPDAQTANRIDMLYVREYRPGKDLNILRNGFALLGNEHFC